MTIGLGHRDGKGKAEGGACAKTALDGDLAALGLDETAHESEAEAGAAAGGVAGEPAEDGWQAFGLDPAAVVMDEELDAVLLLGRAEADVAAFRGVAEGVGDEVIEDGAERAAVALNVGDVLEGD